jgi:hypothetical protein
LRPTGSAPATASVANSLPNPDWYALIEVFLAAELVLPRVQPATPHSFNEFNHV